MKKKIVTILSLLAMLCLSVIGLVACGGGGSWKPSDVTVKDFSKDTLWDQGGAIAQTEKCFYYINGIGDSDEDNNFGVPVKGTLVAVDKQSLKDGDVKSCIVVPKLFVATDYNAGLYFYGEYVYYASPNTSKNSSGEVAKDELVFARTKLDGTETTTYFSVEHLSTQYRIVKNNDDVVIVYYDEHNASLISYSTANKTATTLLKTDEKVKDGESLDACVFTDIVKEGEPVVLYTSIIYAEPYNEESAADDDYERAKMSYNKVYAYVAGQDAKEVLNGNKSVSETYAIKTVKNGKAYYSATKNESEATAKYFSVKLTDLFNKTAGTELFNTKFFDDISNTIIVSDSEVFTVDSTAGFIIRTSLVASSKTELDSITKPVAKASTVKTLLFVNGDYVYYFNTDGALARIKYKNVDEKVKEDVNEQRVSKGSVAIDWFEPIIFNWIGYDGYSTIFFCDSTELGNSYIAYMPLDAEVKAKDTDEDGKDDLWYLDEDKQVLIAIMNVQDKANVFSAKLTEIKEGLDENERLVFDTDKDGNIILDDKGLPVVSAITNVRAEYEKLKEENKAVYDAVTEATVKQLVKYEKALELSRALYPLTGFNKLTADEKDTEEWKDKYNKAHEVVMKLFNEDTTEDSSDFTQIRDLVVVNLNYEHDTAEKYYSAS